jgi:C4-dicarboxylate transporter, DctM subunit
MSSVEIGIISIVAILLLIYGGMYVPVVLALVSFIGVWAIKGKLIIAIKLLTLAASDSIASYLFGVIPLFVLMGLLVGVADMGTDAFAVANQAFRRVRGGLGIATVAANAIFAAITGISIASAAIFTRVAVPEMLRFGYRPRFAVGVVAGSSILGMLIPPSLLLILYAVLTEQSVGDMFLAGVIPGILLSLAFCAAILGTAWLAPAVIGGQVGHHGGSEALMSTRQMIGKLAPIICLVVMVIGGIYGGVFTPTEAGAAGALGALVIAIAKRKLDLRAFWQVLIETGHITASICFLVIAASMYSRMLGLSGIAMELGDFVQHGNLGLYGLLAVYVALLLLLGTVLDSTSIILIMVPLFLPMLVPFEVDLVWFGIITVIGVEIGLLTPPLGIAAYVIKSTLDSDEISLFDIFAGAFPFAVIMLLMVILIIAVPQIALVLI